jgi:dTDP-4-dehydrorhamnose reductase
MKIAILGSGGRLGAALAREWAAQGDEIIGFNHGALDLGNADQLQMTLRDTAFDVLVNCAALTNVDYCESHEEEAMRINRDAVEIIAQYCTK